MTLSAAALVLFGPLHRRERPERADPLQALAWFLIGIAGLVGPLVLLLGTNSQSGPSPLWQKVLAQLSIGQLWAQSVGCLGYAVALVLVDLADPDGRGKPWYFRGLAVFLSVVLATFPVITLLEEWSGLSSDRSMGIVGGLASMWIGIRAPEWAMDVAGFATAGLGKRVIQVLYILMGAALIVLSVIADEDALR